MGVLELPTQKQSFYYLAILQSELILNLNNIQINK